MKERVLFVDDEPNVLDGIRRQLRNRVEIETATSGAAGLAMIRDQGPFAVVVSDMGVPPVGLGIMRGRPARSIPGIWNQPRRRPLDSFAMKREDVRRVTREVERLAEASSEWMTLAANVGEIVRGVVPFDRTCWHPVDPGTYHFTGSLVHNMVCSGAWLAEHEYVLDDVNKWHDLARAEVRAASLFATTLPSTVIAENLARLFSNGPGYASTGRRALRATPPP